MLRPKNNYFLLLQKSSIARSIDRSIDRHIKESFFQFFNFFFAKIFDVFFVRSKTSPTSKDYFQKKKKDFFDKNSSLNHGDGFLGGKRKSFLWTTTDSTERERKKERKKERRGERGAFGSFFFATREVKKGARLNV